MRSAKSLRGYPVRLSIDSNARGGVAVGTQMDVLSNADLFSGNRIDVGRERKFVGKQNRGKKAGLEFLCESSAPKILRVLYRITKNREDAEDALQDSFLRALIHLKDFD